MKIAICTVQVPFTRGGAEYLAESLRAALLSRGYEADILSIPFKWYPPERILESMMMWRTLDLTEVNGTRIDLAICLKFPAYFLNHPRKVLWLLHQHRQAYDLWETEYGDLHHTAEGRRMRHLIVKGDNRFLTEAKGIYTISQTVTDRLSRFNGISAETLYPPPADYDRYYQGDFGEYIYYPSRIDRMKRQKLLVEALQFTATPVRVVLSGAGSQEYIEEISSLAQRKGLGPRVTVTGLVPDDQKRALYAGALGVYFGAYNEDYGYVPLEAFFSAKPVITHTDSGGSLEFVGDDNGFVVEPSPQALARKMDYLYAHKDRAAAMGGKGLELMRSLKMSWDHVIGRLLS